MWTWEQDTGALRLDEHFVATGYSGHGDGRNNPAMQATPDVGPIPQGLWAIQGPPQHGTPHGDFVLHLVPDPTTNTFGRSAFLIHGDMKDPKLAGTASKGCIILPREIRETIWASGDYVLNVVGTLAVT